MPFEVFRRHQRKLMAVVAVFAMVAFTLDFSLFRNLGRGAGENPVVFTLYGQPVRRYDVNMMKLQRAHANLFVSNIFGQPEFFGGTSDEAIQDALIFQHEADRLGMPATVELAKQWLNRQTRGILTPELFDQIYRQNFTQEPNLISDEQLLAEIANQVRLLEVVTLPGLGIGIDYSAMTPMDVFEEYRKQHEQVSAELVEFPAAAFLDQVPEPTEAQVKSYFAKFQNDLPDPDRPTPGFKTPRQVRVEYVVMDEDALIDRFERELTDAQLRSYYEANPAKFPVPPHELPDDLFAGAPDLTPHEADPFAEVRGVVRQTLAAEKARETIAERFEAVRSEVMDPFLEKLDEAAADNAAAKDYGEAATPLPEPVKGGTSGGETLLSDFASSKALEYHATGLLTQEQAKDPESSPIAAASYGGRLSGAGMRFSEFVFQPRSAVYEPFELADVRGRRFLAWKLADREPAVPKLAEVRDRVVAAWKLEQAREKAEAAARAFAEKARQAEGGLATVAAAEQRTVTTTTPAPEFSPSFDIENPSTFGQIRPTQIPQLTRPGETLRKAYFGLKTGQVEVAPNAPKSIYYVLALKDRIQPDIPTAIYNPKGARADLEPEVATLEATLRYRRWIDYLRKQAGVEPETPAPSDQGV